MSETTYPSLGKDSFGNEMTIDATRRVARKTHRCEGCSWKARAAMRVGQPFPELFIAKGAPYIESYGLGEPFHPARYHVACFTDELNA